MIRSPDPHERMVALDCETTGTEVKRGERIKSIGVASGTLDGGLIDGKVWYLLTDGRKSCPESYRIHQIADDDPRCRPEAEVIPEVLAYIGDSKLIMHHGKFDCEFLEAAFKRIGLAMPEWEIDDTFDMAKIVKPQSRRNLTQLGRDLNVPIHMIERRQDREDNKRKGLHDAREDCELTFELWRRLVTPQELNVSMNQADDILPAYCYAQIQTAHIEW